MEYFIMSGNGQFYVSQSLFSFGIENATVYKSFELACDCAAFLADMYHMRVRVVSRRGMESEALYEGKNSFIKY